MKIKNFSAGPSKIPQVVLDQISEDIKEYKNLGYSILELSHRTEAFQEIVNNVKDKISNILNIPKGYEILLIQGGATFQNTFIPANKASLKENVLFLLSGTWGKKTHKDFEKYYNYIIPQLSLYDDFSEDVFKKITQASEDYVYLTSNETIEGVQVRNFGLLKNKNLIIDMSSDICSYKFKWENISYAFAGAQKNLGIPGVTICIIKNKFFEDNNLTSYLDSDNHIKKNSSFNTPPTFSIYLMLKVLNWIEETGGINEIEKLNKIKAEKLYKYLDEKDDVFSLNVPQKFRSLSNIVFNFRESNQTPIFLDYCVQNGFIGLNGHRSVGGIRVSNYNSVDLVMIDEFISFLDHFVYGKK
jgi:phosphoserine aminotransferase